MSADRRPAFSGSRTPGAGGPQARGSGDAQARGSGDARVRLFVALELPEDARAALVRWSSRLGRDRGGRLRPVVRESLHVTLCFLGWQAENDIDAIAAACGIAASEPAPELAYAAGVWLPRRRPRVLAVELEDREAKLARVQSTLAAALTAGGWYEPETRPYLAHVTVARVGAGDSSRPFELPEPPRLEFLGSRIVLYRSRLSRSGARYEGLADVELMRSGSAPASRSAEARER